jgi:Mab-21 protein
VLQALTSVEPALDGLSSYHVRTVALYALDRAVDDATHWQRHTAAAAFLDLLAELDRMLSDGQMPHFFFRRLDLLATVPSRTVDRWRSRVRCLVENRAELIRVLKRRTEDRQVAVSKN